ncbi:spindle and kinetochore-associated protein 3 isoform X1 [Eublepharis macularius]|uniref:Spindle and kinetochore-associated protein 3 isoform X1 n=1 Tax=Eublepharis macularius TaxID=481883 RepID=A0AA97KT69_EUBMA|nr:spindle and kinetochore-associated protein 3 isoform X1 [Eublepharis macularius]XP_054830060.1 spindle and kinetochore-associated protein 3 isoform X1 [Eublepharis macularius]XP_054830061.1 spindle and kinetochore-associated protein 3 isoform X1 [Eublepharis macularius]
MDLTGSFFGKLRALVVTLERQAEQLKQVFHGDETEFEDDSPMRYLHELYSEVRTLKGEVANVLVKNSEERDAIHDFIKASKILMNRNATDLEKIRELFEKYGYKPVITEEATKDEAEIDSGFAKSDQEELKNLACPENSSELDPLVRIPQLSDFGLSKYALPSTWNTAHLLPQAHVKKEEPREDFSVCLSPKAEQFCINGRDLCLEDDTAYLTEDQTIFLLNNAKKRKQANNMNGPSMVLPSKQNLVTPGQKSKVCDYDYMASPAAPTFCTPGLKVPSRKDTILPKSAESNQSDASNRTDEDTHRDHQSPKKEPKQVCAVQMTPNKSYVEEAVASVLPSNKYLECLETPAPPVISDYRNILATPPPAPEITVIPTQILQILSKYNSNVEPPRLAEKVNNEGIAAQFERMPTLGISNKENSEYCG